LRRSPLPQLLHRRQRKHGVGDGADPASPLASLQARSPRARSRRPAPITMGRMATAATIDRQPITPTVRGPTPIMAARTTPAAIAIIRVRPRPEVACSPPEQHGTIDVALQKQDDDEAKSVRQNLDKRNQKSPERCSDLQRADGRCSEQRGHDHKEGELDGVRVRVRPPGGGRHQAR
jgi:hypothetical protein